MGACASKPKEFDNSPDCAPTEAPVSPKKAEPEPEPQTNNNAQEKNNGGENQNESPLVDLSEPEKKAEEPSKSTNAADAGPASEENKAETSNAAEVTEKKVEAAIKSEEKANDQSDAPLVTV